MSNSEDEILYPEKCAIFIDGGYLNSKLKDFGNFPLDLLKFSTKIAKRIKTNRLRTYYYNCLPIIIKESLVSKEQYDAKRKFFDKINLLPRFEVKLGELQYIKGVYKQKMVDVLMSLDIADKCFENQISHAVIVAGDSDFVPAIRKAKDYGATTHLLSHKESTNKDLLKETDEFHKLNREFLEDCKLTKDENRIR
jgi:uncharacterized LabA/DUF88 family protein